ncbi:peptide deformylase chloroplastic-like [Trifolium pratense]|uniref:Peptide deformylase n=1 Tax=Trifolium pratense TaxID=57577 RepID=A0A2K3MM61_TRIPR|nr:peptide deformylase chloroplastic-like [Trifolium pratense]
MASLLPSHPLLHHHHGGSALAAIPTRCFRHSSASHLTLSSTNRTKADFSAAAAQNNIASPADFEFEAPLKVLKYPDPKLRIKNKRIVTFDDDLKKLVHEMFDVMYKTDGIGLSAPQVGINVQLMVFNPVGERGEGEEIVLVNPRVSKYSKNRTLFNEGCLSFPGINADVKARDEVQRVYREAVRRERGNYNKVDWWHLVIGESVKIDARDLKGTWFSVSLSGLPARIFQHEFDHLQAPNGEEGINEDVIETYKCKGARSQSHPPNEDSFTQ